jgi:hypothetical protein
VTICLSVSDTSLPRLEKHEYTTNLGDEEMRTRCDDNVDEASHNVA